MDSKNNDCVICVVGNFKYLKKYFNNFYNQLITVGKYKGEIILLTTYTAPTFLIKTIRKKNDVKVLRFKKIKFDRKTNNILSNLKTFDDPNRHITKNFQWHKLNLFDKRLKRYKYIFYIDINMNVHFDINIILKNVPINGLQARADSYPNYDRALDSQFDLINPLSYSLREKYDLSVTNYFQTGVIYFDTSIIQNNTKFEIINLVKEFPISKTNEQGILNLYFYLDKKIYTELPAEIDGYISYFYWKIKDRKVIITKALKSYSK